MDDVHLLVRQLEVVHLLQHVYVAGMQVEQQFFGLVEEFVERVTNLCRPPCWQRQALHQSGQPIQLHPGFLNVQDA